MAKKGGAFTSSAARARLSLDRRPVAHFLHIGKAAGTAIMVALKQASGTANYRLVREPHQVGLDKIPDTDHVFFCVRDPVDRYVSGFQHRVVQGLPRFFVPWSKGEAKAFARFTSPEALAISLGAGGDEQREAQDAMRAIQHVRSSYWDWFKDPDYFKRRSDHVLWIGYQESLDLKPLADRLGLEKLELPTDPDRANRTPGSKPVLSDVARQNLRDWYARDYMFLELCRDWSLSHDRHGPNGKDTGRAFIDRTMSARPFALRNVDAFRLAQVVRQERNRRRRKLRAKQA
jgi:hypothetical protein